MCATTPSVLYTPTVSPFNPDACTAGDGDGDLADLCVFACAQGYCPIAACRCTSTGTLLNPRPVTNDVKFTYTSDPTMANNDLCTWTCSRGQCTDACKSSSVCTSGSGEGNYGGLCDFSCGYGFCPEPCTCLSNGTQSTPPTFDPTIVGYADVGLDADTYGPLCNFTCSHGYCPTPNACLETITINPAEEDSIPTLPTLPSYDADPNVTYYAADFFNYESQDTSDLSVDVILLESADVSSVSISCDDSM